MIFVRHLIGAFLIFSGDKIALVAHSVIHAGAWCSDVSMIDCIVCLERERERES